MNRHPHEIRELVEYRMLIREGLALGTNQAATPEECVKWWRRERLAATLLGEGVANDVVKDEITALRELGWCPFCGSAYTKKGCQGGCRGQAERASATTAEGQPETRAEGENQAQDEDEFAIPE